VKRRFYVARTFAGGWGVFDRKAPRVHLGAAAALVVPGMAGFDRAVEGPFESRSEARDRALVLNLGDQLTRGDSVDDVSGPQ
jgi:hypothetical protein